MEKNRIILISVILGAVAIIVITVILTKKSQKYPIPPNAEGWSPTPLAEQLHEAVSGVNILNSTNDTAVSKVMGVSDIQFTAVANEYRRLFSRKMYDDVRSEISISSDIQNGFLQRCERLGLV